MVNILLVEDDTAAAALIHRFLNHLPQAYHLSVCTHAGEAFSLAQTTRFDLFLLDIQLPDYQGTKLGKQIRTLPQYKFTPLLFTTELSGEELDAYREIKCYDFLVKPITEKQFLTAVRNALEMGAQLAAPSPVLRLEQKGFVFEYELCDLLYVESYGKRLVIHSASSGGLLSDQISGYSLARILELAGIEHLVQCHKSYLINPQKIRKVDKTNQELFLRGYEQPIPIGEKYRRNLRGWGL